jgi:hypothetical protein
MKVGTIVVLFAHTLCVPVPGYFIRVILRFVVVILVNVLPFVGLESHTMLVTLRKPLVFALLS